MMSTIPHANRGGSRPGRLARGATAMTAVLAVAVFSVLGAGSASAAPGSPPAPVVEVTGTDAVRLDWPAQDAVVADLGGYRIDVLGAAGEDPVAAHVLGDPDDPAITAVADGVAAGDVAAAVTGLSADSDYRFRVVVLASDGAEVLVGGPSGIVRTAPEPVAEAPAPDAPEAAGVEPESQAARDAADGPDQPAATVEAPADPAPAAGIAPLLSALATQAAEPAPRVTVRGGTAVEVDYADFRSGSSETYPSISLALLDADGALVRTISTGVTVSSAVVTALSPATSYRIQAIESGFDEDWNPVELRRSEPSALFTTRAVIEAPGVIPAVPTIEAVSGSEVRVSWAAVEDGGDVRSYTVRLYNEAGTVLQTKTGVDPFTAGTQAGFTGLSSLTGYTATVQAIGYETGRPELNGAESGHSALVYTLKGIPGAPGVPTFTWGTNGSADMTVNWTPPASDGGYPITAYDIEVFAGSVTSVNLNSIVRTVRVTGDQTSWTFTNATLIGTNVFARVAALNRAGSSSFALSATSVMPTTATPSTAVTVTGTNVQFTDVTDTGATVSWALQTGANAPVAGTGYLLRVTEQRPGITGNSPLTYLPPHAPADAPVGQINAYGIVDLGTGFTTAGRQSATIGGLEPGKSYRVAITPYVGSGGDRAYRTSSAPSAALLTTTGTSVPSRPTGTPPAPRGIAVDSVQWTGSALGDGYNGGSPITGYVVSIYRSGSATPVQTLEADINTEGNPTVVFGGLERDTPYQVAFAGVNANGTGTFSAFGAIGYTLARPVAGTVEPPYSSLAQLRGGILAGDVTPVLAAAAGVTGKLESSTRVSVAPPYDVEELGEVWLYASSGAPVHQTTFDADGARAAASWTLADLPTGEYALLFFGDGGKLVAVTVEIVKPVIGRTELDDAVFRWGFNDESSNGAFFGGCNYFVAGKAPDVGSAQVFTASRYSSQDGNVTIVKPNAAGEYVQANWATKCLTRAGAPVTSSVTTPVTEQQIVITGGAGWVDPSTRSAEIAWDGDFTVVYYGGLTFWYGSDPVLRVENGVGTVTATLSGYGADMDDLTKWEPITPRQVTLATLRGVQMTSSGFTVTPDYLGVAIEVEPGSSAQAVPQPAKTADNAAYWGSFPQDFVDFQLLTGQSAYWYTSGGSQDRGKPTLPLTVVYDSILDDTGAGEGGSGTGVESPEAQAPPRNAGLSRPVATAQATSIDGIDTLRRLIESGVVTRLSAAAAGIPDSIPAGQRLDFSFAWDGDDTEGVIWLYPDVVYVGTFRIVDGVVHVAVDSSVILTEGENFAVFFGDAGTAVAVSFLVDGRLAATAVDSAEDAAETPAVTEIPALPISAPADQVALLWLLLAGGGGLAVLAAAGAGTVLVLRRRQVPLGG